MALIAIVHQGITGQSDLLSLNKHCGKTFCHRDFKLCARDHNSYGFTFIGFVSMETLVTFEPNVFVKLTKILTSLRQIFFSTALNFILEPAHGPHNLMD